MLNHLNKELMKGHAAILAEVEATRDCATKEQEIAHMVAGGKARMYLNQLASTQTGWLIKLVTSDVIEPDEMVTVYPEEGKPTTQSLNATVLTVASYAVLMSGYTSQELLTTALTNWFEKDQPDTNKELDFEQLALDIITQFIADDILSGDTDTGRMEDGAYFVAHPATELVLKHRIEAMQRLWDTAPPKMQPMKWPVTWNVNGTCEIPNLTFKNKVKQPFVDALNIAGNTAYKVNAAIRAEILEQLELCEFSQEEEQTLEALIKLDTETSYYFPHTPDYRGRFYARGGLTTFQGIKALRAAFDFAEYKKVNEHGLFLHIANAYGMAKISITERIQWVRNNHMGLMSTKAPTLYAERARLAYIEYKTTGMTNIICRIDGTCSGVQITSGLYLDKKTAEAVNVCASSFDDVPADVYGIVANRCIALAKGAEKKIFEQFERDITKKVIMILAYGAGEDTRIKTVGEFLQGEGARGNAKKLERIIMSAINLVCPSITKLNKNLNRILAANPTHKLKYDLSDCTVKLVNFESEHLNIRGTDYSARLVGTSNKDSDGLARGIAPNFVHSLDSELLRKAVISVDGDVSCIHDDMGVHSCDVEPALKALRAAYYEVIKADPLETLYNALDAKYIKQDNGLILEEVLESSYMFS